MSTDGPDTDAPGTDGPGTGGPEASGTSQHADLPADAASRGELPADPDNTEPTPGSDNDGIEPGYTPPSET